MANPRIEMIGKKFNRFTVLSEAAPDKFTDDDGNKITLLMYLCRCDCGVEKIVKGSRLRSGATKSCGCWSKEVALSKIPKMIQKSTKYDPYQSLAVKVWKKHYDDDGLSFNDFMHLCQQNCHYCGQETYNHLKNKNIIFSYNGLDRIDSNLGHTLDNCVPCCIICNRGKSNQPYQQAIEWMRRLANNFNINKIIEYQSFNLPGYPELKFAKAAYRSQKSRVTTLSFEEFYMLSKQKCYYCDGNLSNQRGCFDYNGLDRVDSTLRYIHGNVVPCCKWCNFAKKNLTLNQFSDWINKLKFNAIPLK